MHLAEFVRECDNDLHLVGKIVSCPQAKTGNVFRVDWFISGTSVKPIWVQDKLANNKDNKQLMQEACHVQEKREGDGTCARFGRTKTATVTQPRPRVSNVQQPLIYGENGTPPAIMRAQAVAALGAAPTFSELSSLSSQSRSSHSRVTRSNPDNTIESETDDGDDLDEEDNAYLDLLPGTCPEDLETSHQEENPEDIDGSSATGDIGSLLANLQWKCREIKDNETICETRKLTDAQPGFKLGFSGRLKYPFNCLKLGGGFDYTFVARIAFNSNQCAKTYIIPKYPN